MLIIYNKLKIKMVKILMRADTHVSFSVPAEEPEAKCTKSQAMINEFMKHHYINFVKISIVRFWQLCQFQ